MQEHWCGNFRPIAIEWTNRFGKPAQLATSTATELDPPTIDQSRRSSTQRPMVCPSARWSCCPMDGDMDLIDGVKLPREISRQEAREPWR